MMRAVILAAVLTACGSEHARVASSPQPAAVPPAGRPTPAGASGSRTACEAAVHHVIAFETGYGSDLRHKLEGVAAEHCLSDGWSASVIACLTRAASGGELQACQHDMTQQQLDNIMDAITTAVRDATSAPPGQTGLLAVTNLEPKQGDAAGGTDVRIWGSGFVAEPRTAKVYFGAREGTVVRFAGDSKLIVRAPAGTPGDVVDVRVVFEPGDDLELPKAFTYVARP